MMRVVAAWQANILADARPAALRVALRMLVFVLTVYLLAACQAGGELGPAPLPPSPRVEIADGAVHVSWESVPGAARYRLYWLEAPASAKPPPTSAQEVTSPTLIDGLQNGRTYYLALTALSEGGESDLSDAITVTPRPPPNAPQEVSASVTSAAVTLTWPRVPTADAYKVYLLRSADLPEAGATSAPSLLGVRATDGTTYTEPSLINGIDYSFVVTAINSSGESLASTVVNATPGPYRNLTAGAAHTCVIDVRDALWCWGSSSRGQIYGKDMGTVAATPERIGLDVKWKIVAAGTERTCGVGRDESLVCWGDNDRPLQILVPPSRAAEIPPAKQWTSLSSRYDLSCAVRGDGTLWCWGDGSTKKLTFDADWRDVAVGDSNVCGLKRDRSYWCLDASFDLAPREPVRITDTQVWTTISRGVVLGNTCAIDNSGKLWCGGNNARGQLGRGTEGQAEFESLAPVASDATWLDVAVGAHHACGVQSDGSLWCWGTNDFGQLGLDTREDQYAPIQTGIDAKWSRVAAGVNHTCAMRQNGSTWCAGRNDFGQLGRGESSYAAEPTRIISDVSHAAANADTSCVILRNQKTWCWGKFGYGFPSLPPYPDIAVSFDVLTRYGQNQVPVLVDAARNFTHLFALGERICGAASDGALWCWGGRAGRLVEDVTTPERIAGAEVLGVSPLSSSSTTWARAVVRDDDICVIRDDQTVWCANDAYVNLGVVAEPIWVQVLAGSSAWVQLVAGDAHACALNAQQQIWCWGNNGDGQVGAVDGADIVDVPVQVGIGRRWRSVGAGAFHSCAIAVDDTLWCWGRNTHRQASLAARVKKVLVPTQVGADADWSSVATGYRRTCAVKKSGSLWCMGSATDEANAARSAYDPPTSATSLTEIRRGDGVSNWASAIVGADHNCALTTNSELYCWGRNDQGQVGDGRAWSVEWRPVTFPSP